MIYFQANQRFFKMLGIERPVERGERRQFSIIKLLKNVYYFLYVGVLYCWGFIIFVYEHRKHLEEAPMEMGVLSACFASTVQYIFLLSDTSKIWKLMEDFQAVVDKCTFLVFINKNLQG